MDSFDTVWGSVAEEAYDNFFGETVSYQPEIGGDAKTIVIRVMDSRVVQDERDEIGEIKAYYAEATFALEIIVDPQKGDAVTRADGRVFLVSRIMDLDSADGRVRVLLRRAERVSVEGSGTSRIGRR